ncbi:MAG: Acetyltransferase (isoleucine patch superfamily)-like protein [Bryobacterales bacterium]|nr:Acetyltransferase (isoleucine patch superfamily)-like protein [Bryobacterales bacterium]
MSLESFLFRQTYSMTSRIRVAGYRRLGMRIGAQCRLENIRIRRPRQIELGRGNALSEGCWLWPVDAEHTGIRIRIGAQNYFNRDCMIDSCGQIEIGDHNMFGPGVYITDSNHSMPDHGWVADGAMDVGRVVIGNGCWIGAKAVILKNVELGDRCVVAAGAVVTKCFPAYSVVAGVPARLMRTAKAD